MPAEEARSTPPGRCHDRRLGHLPADTGLALREQLKIRIRFQELMHQRLEAEGEE